MFLSGVHIAGGGDTKSRVSKYSLLIRYISSVGRAIDF